MKYDNIPAFEKHLENASPIHFSDIYLILSKDAYDRKSVEEVLIGYLRKGQNNPQIKIFQGDNLTIHSLMSELNTIPFLSDRQIVILQNAEKMRNEEKDSLSHYFDHPNRKVTLILSAETVPANTKFYKKAEKSGVILDIRETHSRQFIEQWIQQKIRKSGKQITPEAVGLLLQQLGADRALLDQELEKLICYSGDRPTIDSPDVESICLVMNQETIWQLGEAILTRNSPTSLRILKALFKDGAEFIPLIRQIRNQVQRDYEICSILSHGGSPAQFTEAFPYMRGNILKKHLQIAGTFGIERFKRALILIDDVEIRSRNSSDNPELLAEQLILKLAQ